MVDKIVENPVGMLAVIKPGTLVIFRTPKRVAPEELHGIQRGLSDAARLLGTHFMVLPEGMGFEIVPESEMNAAGWFRREEVTEGKDDDASEY